MRDLTSRIGKRAQSQTFVPMPRMIVFHPRSSMATVWFEPNLTYDAAAEFRWFGRIAVIRCGCRGFKQVRWKQPFEAQSAKTSMLRWRPWSGMNSFAEFAKLRTHCAVARHLRPQQVFSEWITG
ncbi:MAG: hypothetical protein ABJM82_07975 [Shimia thalassica]|uniref:hypothetical protein n=1 Tax=Shimia thalassica TaxID=1715693 RepID=UPI003299FA7D